MVGHPGAFVPEDIYGSAAAFPGSGGTKRSFEQRRLQHHFARLNGKRRFAWRKWSAYSIITAKFSNKPQRVTIFGVQERKSQ